jgi:L-ascorbate metabolism protein UlaG (beta-lactamase superfamily)
VKGRRFRWWRGLLALGLAGLLTMLALGCTSFGRSAAGPRLARVEGSPQFHDGSFRNPQPIVNDTWAAIASMFDPSPHVVPPEPLRFSIDHSQLAEPPRSGLRATWFGHSTTLLELGHKRILTDPIWSERASPYGWIGPSRFSAAKQPLEALPRIDVVVVSHDHYDHLDHGTIVRLIPTGATFIVPLGVGDTLLSWGVPEANLVEVDWWQRHRIDAELEIVSVPARHASGRSGLDTDESLWSGYAFIGRKARAYYSGDTGLFPGMREIGERLGPFDLTLIEVGQYGSSWPDWHVGPEQAVRAHQMVKGRVLLPVHWAAFALATHGWTEPIERALSAADTARITIATPRLGQSFEPSEELPRERWWPKLPFQTARQNPIRSSGVD